jgi:hypothetical protein
MTGHSQILLIYPTLTHMIYPVHDRPLGLTLSIWHSKEVLAILLFPRHTHRKFFSRTWRPANLSSSYRLTVPRPGHAGVCKRHYTLRSDRARA